MSFKKILAAMESEDLAVVEPTEQDLLGQVDDKRLFEADAVSAEFSEVMDAVSSLEEMRDLVAQYHEDGGMSEETAVAVSFGLEHIYQSLGAYKNGINGLSLESFEKDPKQATKLVMESIQERVAAVWKNILEMIKRLLRWTQDFVGDFISTTASLSRRAKGVDKRITQLGSSGNKLPSGSVEDEVLCRRLYSPDVKPSQIVPEFTRLAGATVLAQYKLSEVAFQDLMAVADSLKKTRHGQNFSFEKNSMDLKKWTMDALNKVPSVLFDNQNKSHGGVPQAPMTTKVYSSQTFLGGLGWYAFIPKDFENVNDFRMGTYRGEDGSYDGLPILSVAEMQKVTDVVAGVDKLQKLGKEQLNYLRMLQGIMELVVQDIAQVGQFSGYSEEVKSIRQNSVRALLRLVTSQGMNSLSHYIKVARDMLRLTEQSLSKYEMPQASKSKELAVV